MDLGAILIALLTGLVIKVAVMVLAARLVLKVYQASYQSPPRRLWLLLPESDLPEVRVLWWSLLLFFLSEMVCGIEAYILLQSSVWVGLTHGLVSSAGMGLFALGVWMHLDKRLFRYGGVQCLGNRICKGCTIAQEDGCKFRMTLLLVATFVVLAAAVGFLMPTARMVVDMSRWTLPFPALNFWFDHTVEPWLLANVPSYKPSGVAYFLPEAVLILEYRVLPAVAGLVGIGAIVGLKRGWEAPALRALVFAVGMLCYSYLAMVLNAATGDLLIGSLGHEIAEFWFLMIVAEFLRRSFPPGERDVPAGA